MELVIDEKKGTFTLTGKVDEVTSKSGKMLLLSTTHGNAQTAAKYKGKEVYLNMNMGVFVAPKS